MKGNSTLVTSKPEPHQRYNAPNIVAISLTDALTEWVISSNKPEKKAGNAPIMIGNIIPLVN